MQYPDLTLKNQCIVSEMGMIPVIPLISTYHFCFHESVSSISHGNSAAKSRFSINKHILDIHGHSLKHDTNEVFRVVKDAIFHHTSLLDGPITKKMDRSVKHRGKDANLIWKLELLLEKEAAKKREEEQKRKDKEREEESKKELAKELEAVQAALSQVENGVNIADESV